jgi:AcrR family transcriptional regulator
VKTRDRILEAARTMFNRETVSQVSTHRIATELGISQGNLHYHFKSKQQIVELLFRRLAAEMAPFGEADAAIDAIDDMWLTLHLAFEVIERYRFIHRDIDFVVREYPTMLPRARAMTAGYLDGVRRMCRKLVVREVLRASPGEVEVLALQTVLNATCWHTFSNLALPSAAGAVSTGRAAYHTLTLLAPYASPAARLYLDYLRAKYCG